jgi:hypothetical protein
VYAKEYLYEDAPSKIDKLRALIDHPSTDENIRLVARNRLAYLISSDEPQRAPQRISVETNVAEADLDRPFLAGVSLGELYDNLCALNPSPNEIKFGRQGIIHMMVPPPFMGKTKQQYINEVWHACPGARNISCDLRGTTGYLFIISFI